MKLSDYEEFPAILPVVVEDEIFLYPFMISPIFLTDQKDIDAASFAMDNNSLIFVASSVEGKEGNRDLQNVYAYGVIGSIMRKVHMPDGRVKILFQGLSRGKISQIIGGDINQAMIEQVQMQSYNKLKIDALMNVLKENIKSLSAINSQFPADLIKTLDENEEPNRIADLISSMLKLEKSIAYKLYKETDIENRLLGLIEVVSSEIESAKVQREIRSKVHNKIEQTNKEYFLKEQLKEIQQELGMDTQREEEVATFREKIEKLKPHLDEDAYLEIQKQIDRYARMHPESSEASMIQTYLEYVLEIPFDKLSKDKLSVEKVATRLDKDHYSLTKPKERITEYFSVKELGSLRGVKLDKTAGAILCFAGPPGVGKTSLANSISKALNRPLVRIALGGLEDVNELRGHRRTYLGAMPGRIVQGLIEAKTMDPIIVLDEIDKVGRSMRGDPTAALLEILDQNKIVNIETFNSTSI